MINTLVAALLIAVTEALAPVNPDVTQATIGETICHHGWTRTVRPPREYTDGIKQGYLSQRGEPGSNARLYELDHVIPLELGGSPDNPENLRLQPWPEAKRKDQVENCLKVEVCSLRMPLDEAQQRIWTDWKEAGTHCTPAWDFGR